MRDDPALPPDIRIDVEYCKGLGLVPGRRTGNALVRIWMGFHYQPRTACFIKRRQDPSVEYYSTLGYDIYDINGRFLTRVEKQRDVRQWLIDYKE